MFPSLRDGKVEGSMLRGWKRDLMGPILQKTEAKRGRRYVKKKKPQRLDEVMEKVEEENVNCRGDASEKKRKKLKRNQFIFQLSFLAQRTKSNGGCALSLGEGCRPKMRED